jgi:hypothetical protein
MLLLSPIQDLVTNKLGGVTSDNSLTPERAAAGKPVDAAGESMND